MQGGKSFLQKEPNILPKAEAIMRAELFPYKDQGLEQTWMKSFPGDDWVEFLS